MNELGVAGEVPSAHARVRRDLPWAARVCCIAYLGIMAGRSILDSNVGNLVGIIIAAVVANLRAGHTGRPTSIVLFPAIVMLVSGSIGFRGLAAMAEGSWWSAHSSFLRCSWWP